MRILRRYCVLGGSSLESSWHRFLQIQVPAWVSFNSRCLKAAGSARWNRWWLAPGFDTEATATPPCEKIKLWIWNWSIYSQEYWWLLPTQLDYSFTKFCPSRDSIASISKSCCGWSNDISPKKPGGSCATSLSSFTRHLQCAAPPPARKLLDFNYILYIYIYIHDDKRRPPQEKHPKIQISCLNSIIYQQRYLLKDSIRSLACKSLACEFVHTSPLDTRMFHLEGLLVLKNGRWWNSRPYFMAMRFFLPKRIINKEQPQSKCRF